jgi:hypothetical protein
MQPSCGLTARAARREGAGQYFAPGPRAGPVHDRTWTTDRSRAVQRWSELEPGLAAELSRLHSWISGERHTSPEEAKRALADDGIIAAIVERFDSLIGLWADDPEAQ